MVIDLDEFQQYGVHGVTFETARGDFHHRKHSAATVIRACMIVRTMLRNWDEPTVHSWWRSFRWLGSEIVSTVHSRPMWHDWMVPLANQHQCHRCVYRSLLNVPGTCDVRYHHWSCRSMSWRRLTSFDVLWRMHSSCGNHRIRVYISRVREQMSMMSSRVLSLSLYSFQFLF